MDLMSRGGQSHIPRTNDVTTPSAHGSGTVVENPKRQANISDPKWLRLASVVLLFSITILGIGIAILLYFGAPNEAKHVDSSKYQAVFLNNGQAYFGKLKAINNKFVDLRGIFYLNTPAQSTDSKDKDKQPTSLSLVKLGCELHAPYDEMIINRDQVSFWENLKSDGQLAQAIAKWKDQNPQGQKCSTSTNSTQQSQGATDQNAQNAPPNNATPQNNGR